MHFSISYYFYIVIATFLLPTSTMPKSNLEVQYNLIWHCHNLNSLIKFITFFPYSLKYLLYEDTAFSKCPVNSCSCPIRQCPLKSPSLSAMYASRYLQEKKKGEMILAMAKKQRWYRWHQPHSVGITTPLRTTISPEQVSDNHGKLFQPCWASSAWCLANTCPGGGLQTPFKQQLHITYVVSEIRNLRAVRLQHKCGEVNPITYDGSKLTTMPSGNYT